MNSTLIAFTLNEYLHDCHKTHFIRIHSLTSGYDIRNLCVRTTRHVRDNIRKKP